MAVPSRISLARHVRPLGWASLVSNSLLVVTGGAVRLTGSGLGCPTWPRCTDESFTPHGALDVHEAIEFGNRMITFLLTAVAVATFVAAWQTGRRDLRVLSIVLGLGVPAQAVVGGVTVLTDLNPWVVSFHLLCSMAIIGLAVLFVRRIDQPAPEVQAGPVVALAWATFAAAWVVLYVGTVVTGSGPHAGDVKAPRNGLDPLQMSQLHADAVFLLVGLTIGLLVAVHATGGTAEARRAVLVLLAVEVAQGAIGFVQYATDLPELLVGFHMFGAALISATVTWSLLAVRTPEVEALATPLAAGAPGGSGRRPRAR